MHGRLRAALGPVVATVLGLSALLAPAAEAGYFASPFKGSATVTGRILIDGTHKPAARACVFMDSPRGYGQIHADRQGRFRFHNIPDATYLVRAMGCAANDFAYLRLAQSSRVHVSVSGHATKAVVISVKVGGKITGEVTDAATGKPADNVCAFGRLGSTRVVDGRYRLAQEAPGQIPVSFHVCKNGEDERYPFTSTYWPGTRDATQAEPVRVRAGRTTAGIDVALPRMGRITGRVTNGTTSAPLVNSCVQFDDGLRGPTGGQGLPYPGNGGVPTTAGGAFDLLMPPGSYVVGASTANVTKNVGTCGTALFWYPGTTDLAAAQHVTVSAGTTTPGIAITTPAGFIH